MIWSHVTGCVMSRPAASATDLRYQSTWVLAHSGATTSWPSHVAPSMAPCRTPSDSARLLVGGERGEELRPSANSAVNTGSRLIRSIDGSSAASRRSSWMRCSVALVGQQLGVDLVLVGAAPLGDARLAERPAEAGRRVGVGVDVPRQRGNAPSSDPHAVAATTMTTTADAARDLARRTWTPFWPRDRCCTMAPPTSVDPMAALVRSCRRCCSRVADNRRPRRALNGSSPGVDHVEACRDRPVRRPLVRHRTRAVSVAETRCDGSAGDDRLTGLLGAYTYAGAAPVINVDPTGLDFFGAPNESP